MALSRTHTSAKVTDQAKLLLLNKTVAMPLISPLMPVPQTVHIPLVKKNLIFIFVNGQCNICTIILP